MAYTSQQEKKQTLEQVQREVSGALSGLMHGRYATYARKIVNAERALAGLRQYEERTSGQIVRPSLDS